METLDRRLEKLKENSTIRIMIMGLGSVGNYLLDYLMSSKDRALEIYVAGRNRERMLSDVNIVRVASMIRGQNRSHIHVVDGVDFDHVEQIAQCLKTCKPDIIVNSTRAYAHLKYGSISWSNVRAYGIWAPLAVKYIKNIMEAYEQAGCGGIVIQTSYSDAVIPWMRSAGKPYPDFGSGNLNHLIPRIRFALGQRYEIEDCWNMDITYATGHFHDVVISKEGHTEGVEQLIRARYKGEILQPDWKEIFELCKIPMPVDAKRNMMNASSNYEIIQGILDVVRENKTVKLHCPGVFGEMGGYPVILDGSKSSIKTYIDQESFSLEEMRKANSASMFLDGIEKIEDGALYYTDALIEKAKERFGVSLMKKVSFADIEQAARFLIDEVIEKYIGQRNPG